MVDTNDLGSYHPNGTIRVHYEVEDLGVHIHEYVHHLQMAMPELEAVFRREHLRRIAAAKGAADIVPLPRYPGVMGQRVGYVDEYAGAIYEGRDFRNAIHRGAPDWIEHEPLESAARHLEMLFHPMQGHERLDRMYLQDRGC